ncbi:hypothetical protein JCM24511_02167 [Saitozyma sp. JCM 24511]|nr:hypothetical protein JCM24511_02167 [Saitozyma sp. JCM 24511]
MANYLTLSVILFACIGSWTWGYVAGIIASTLGQPSFSSYMGFNESNTSTLQGLANALFSVGGFVGCYASVFVNERKGRLAGIFVGCVLDIIGSALSAGAVQIAMFIVGRFVVGLGVGFLLVLVPLYESEITPHNKRGLLVGLHGVMLCVGYVSSNWIGYGFFFVENTNINWRLPLAIGGVPACLLAACVFRLPQSPRYLVQTGDNEGALDVCRRLHYDPAHPESDLYLREHAQIVQQHAIDQHSPASWASMFRIAHYRKRAIIGHTTMFFVQCSGNLVITNYAPILYGKLGYDANKQLLMAGAWITMCPFGNLLNAFLLDKVGRRLLLSGGLMGCTLCLVAEAVSVARFQQTGSQAASLAAVAFLFVHMFFFCTTQDASSYVYVSEIFPTHIRPKGVAISVSGLFLSTLIFVSAAPQGFQNIGWKYYFVLMFPAFVGSLTEFFFWPETRGLPLEEIAAKFGDDTAAPLEDVMKHGAKPTEPRGDDSIAASNVDLEKARHELVEQV